MRFLLSVLAAFFLTGCMLASDPQGVVCPRTGVLPDTDVLAILGADKPDLQAELWLRGGHCKVDTKKKEVDLALDLGFMAQKNAAMTAGTYELPYFVAVLTPEEEVVKRGRFTVEVEFDETGRAVMTEERDFDFSVADISNIGAYKIVTGFEVTPEQLQYNKEH